MTLKPGTRLGPYEILSPLGAGGMGEVYKARDTRLERIVAIKVLPKDLAADQEFVSRFEKEARLASSLNHPNIITIYEIERSDSILYIAMEFVDGETLAELLDAGPMPIRKACGVAAQIAAGLTKAHEARIVHRDLKPQNVMINRDGLAKILDFGLGKVTTELPEYGPDSTTWTSYDAGTLPGRILGTPAYMSPQQAGGQAVDFRSDQFSLGSLLYQMVTGIRPFRRATLPQTMAAIIEKDPEPVEALNPKVPLALRSIIRRCLAKMPEDRYARTEELCKELQALEQSLPELDRMVLPSFLDRTGRWPALLGIAVLAVMIVAGVRWFAPSLSIRSPLTTGSLNLPEEKQLAVLPFSNVGNDPANQAFCDGLVEILTSKLSQLEQFQSALRVIPASEIRQEGIQSARDARRVFGATLVITGSVQRVDERVRLTINLVDPQTLRQINAKSIDTEVRDASVLQDGVVLDVAALLGIDLSPQVKQVLMAGGTTVPGTYDFYMQGRGYLQRYQDGQNLDYAIGLFQNAVKQDPSYALAYAALCQSYWRKYELTKDSQWAGSARRDCNTALKLNDKLAQVYVTLGMIDTGTGRYEDAIQKIQRGLQLDPVNADGYSELAKTYEALGKIPEAESTYVRAVTARPGFWGTHNDLARFYFRFARYPEAEKEYRRITELSPDNPRGYNGLGAVYLTQQRFPEAAAMFEKSAAIQPSDYAYSNLGTVYFYLGRYADAARRVERALEINDRNYRYWRNLAAAYQRASGEQQKARGAFQRAAELAEQQRSINPLDAALLMDLADCYSMLGEPQRARDLLRQALELAPEDVSQMYQAAIVYEQLKDREAALDAIGKAIAGGYSRDLIDRSPDLAQLRADPRFQGLRSP